MTAERFTVVRETTCDLPPHASVVWWLRDEATGAVLFDGPFIERDWRRGINDVTAERRAREEADKLSAAKGGR